MTAPEPVHFGRYVLTRILGRGALGRVYHGQDTVSAQPLAVRVIRAHVQSELNAATRLTHPGIIRVFDIGETGPFSFLAMTLRLE